jgi:phospholipase C
MGRKMKNLKLKSALLSTAAMLAVAATFTLSGPVAADQDDHDHRVTNPNSLHTKTPIKHLVVIFGENISFDHYFGSYPNALNPEGEPLFEPARNTPRNINNLLSKPSLLDNNPNLNPANGAGASNPFRLDRTQAATADQNHAYTAEEQAYDGGKMDLFPADTGRGTNGGAGAFGTTAQVMGYFDGNTVTAMWNYAQNYAMSDNSFSDAFGPSTPGAINLIAGQTNGAVVPAGMSASVIPDGQGGLTLINDTDPTGDVCSSATKQVSFTGKNIGNLLNDANISWGSFMGGFNLGTTNSNGSTGCTRSSVGVAVGQTNDYIAHHAWFQYYPSTANPTHARPHSLGSIGFSKIPGTQTAEPANHNYDLDDFYAAVRAGNYPAVSFVKLPAVQDAHPGYSDPLDEQIGTVKLINFLQEHGDWDSTAVIIAYDDSDGWYDHVMTPIKHASFSTADAVNGAGNCGIPGVTPVPTNASGQPVAGRCGPGPRQPFLVISPWAKKNYVSHVLTTQASVTQFIEDNWLKGERIGGGSFDATTGSIMDMFDFRNEAHSKKLILDPALGTVVSKHDHDRE